MTHPEALLSGPSAALTVIERPAVRGTPAAYGRRELSPAQIRWCAANLKAFDWPRAERLKETV
jgi:hypothetical protein